MPKRVVRRFRLVVTMLSALVFLGGVVTTTSANATLPNDYAGQCARGTYGCANGALVVSVVAAGGGQSTCYFVNSTPDMGSCANIANAYSNDGYQCKGCDVVRLYWGYNYGGAWACLTPGWGWQKGYPGHQNRGPITFSFGSNLAGYGQTVFNNVASFRWSGSCS
jgi:hypothetical protein